MTIKSAKFVDYMGKHASITITDTNDNVIGVPFDPDNTDYQEYLKWVDEGNTAEAAD
jgi:hypothetical protein